MYLETFGLGVIIIIVICLGIIVINFIYKKIKPNRFYRLSKAEQNDLVSKYYELRHDITILQFSGTILIFIFSYLGYDNLKGVSEDAKNYLLRIDTLENRYSNLQKVLKETKDAADSIIFVKNESLKALSEVKTMHEKIKVEMKNVSYTYIVQSLDPKKSTFKFEDLKTINKTDIPVYDKVPTVYISRTCNLSLMVKSIDKEGFTIYDEIEHGSSGYDGCEYKFFDVIIIF